MTSVGSSGDVDDLQTTRVEPKTRRRSSFVRGRIYSSGQNSSTVLGTCEWSAVEQAACNTVREVMNEAEKECSDLSSRVTDNIISDIHKTIEDAEKKGCIRQSLCASLQDGLQKLSAEEKQWEEALYDFKELASRDTKDLSLPDPKNIGASIKQRADAMDPSPNYTAIVQRLTALHNTLLCAVDQIQLFAEKADVSHDVANLYFKKQVKMLGNIHNPQPPIEEWLLR